MTLQNTRIGRLGKQRYMLYVVAQLLGACCGAALLRLSLPPTYLDTPFITAGSLTKGHPVQVNTLDDRKVVHCLMSDARER